MNLKNRNLYKTIILCVQTKMILLHSLKKHRSRHAGVVKGMRKWTLFFWKPQKSGYTNPCNNTVICLNTGTIGEGSSAVVGRLSCGYMFILFNFFLLTPLLCSFYILISALWEEGENKESLYHKYLPVFKNLL